MRAASRIIGASYVSIRFRRPAVEHWQCMEVCLGGNRVTVSYGSKIKLRHDRKSEAT